jgi:predicted GNAT superfamily acetyltransferase
LLSKDDVAKLLKVLYSLKQAPRLWQQFLAAALQELGFEPLDSDNCIYLNSTIKVIIVTYIDDFLIITKSIPAITELKELLASKFSIKELGLV